MVRVTWCQWGNHKWWNFRTLVLLRRREIADLYWEKLPECRKPYVLLSGMVVSTARIVAVIYLKIGGPRKQWALHTVWSYLFAETPYSLAPASAPAGSGQIYSSVSPEWSSGKDSLCTNSDANHSIYYPVSYSRIICILSSNVLLPAVIQVLAHSLSFSSPRLSHILCFTNIMVFLIFPGNFQILR